MQIQKNGYRSSSINIHEVKPVNDSTTMVIYSNSFKNDKDTLRVLKVRGQWLVDLKYLYEHDMDTSIVSITEIRLNDQKHFIDRSWRWNRQYCSLSMSKNGLPTIISILFPGELL
jgi:hypothetical protein